MMKSYCKILTYISIEIADNFHIFELRFDQGSMHGV